CRHRTCDGARPATARGDRPAWSRGPAAPRRRWRRGNGDGTGGADDVRQAGRKRRDRKVGCLGGYDGFFIPERTAMKVTHLRRAALVITAAALLGCGEPPLGPVPPPPQASLIGSTLQATGLLGCTPLPTATATQTVGAAGG